MKRIEKYGIILRFAEVDDAEFILSLRTDPKLGKFISYTDPDIATQRKWIENYKKREKSGQEYYFIAEDKKGDSYGTIRLYNFDERSFEIGSWLFRADAPLGMAIKAHFIGFEVGFEKLQAEYCRFDIRKENTGVLRYMQDFITNLIGEDELNYYFTLSKENFYKRRSEIALFSVKSKKGEAKIFIHPTAEIKSNNIGEGTSVWQFCVVLKDAIIGRNCNLNYNVFIENDVILGNNVTVKSGVQIWNGIRLEDNVFIGPNVTFTNDLVPRSKIYPKSFEKTVIKKGASIGANATIIAGNEIGAFALIGAGSVITKSVGKNELWVGNPARIIGYVTREGDILDLNLIHKESKKKYGWINNELKVVND